MGAFINLSPFISFSLLLTSIKSLNGLREILHVTDFHYDDRYSETGNVKKMCHSGNEPNPKVTLGKYGNFLCDAPMSLLERTMKGAKSVVPNPELILWTGDTISHIDDYDEKYSINALRETTALFESEHHFRGVRVLPVFGNHDYAPADQFPESMNADKKNSFYQSTYDMWKHWINPTGQADVEATFLKGGYYKYVHTDGTIFLMLNTNLYYRKNTAIHADHMNPADQFTFMEKTLKDAQQNGQKVHIVAHIPPGVSIQRRSNLPDVAGGVYDGRWFRPEYNEPFLKIIVDHAQTIKWMIFGHNHHDDFHLVKDPAGKTVQVMLAGPSVTPWSGAANIDTRNPGFRVIDYDENTWDYHDIRTYFIYLEQLNAETKQRPTKWSLEYSMKTAYGMDQAKPITPNSFAELLQKFKSKGDTLFGKYIQHYNVMGGPVPATRDKNITPVQKVAFICAAEFADYGAYDKCVKERKP